MKAKEVGIWVGVIVILIGGLWLLINAINSSPSPSTPLTITIPEAADQDFIRSTELAANSAKVILIEYSDFQCPACASAYPIVKKLGEDFQKDLKIIYRFFPLTQIHQNALISAQAAYAAGLQGKFWEMHDILFENQDSWANDKQAKKTFADYASRLNLDLDKFSADIESNSTTQAIRNAENSAISLGINSTPTFFINGVHIQNPGSYEKFKQIIQNEINKN